MKQTNLKIKDLLSKREKLTFLIGMDCSVDAPSSLPNKQMMIETIINYFCPESERKRILNIEDLKLEQLIEIIRYILNEKLKIIDYFGLCTKPNLQHFFLADIIKKGQFVMTTNFDSLIEYALLKSEVPLEKIIPVITKDDFEIFYNPIQLLKKGFKTVFKIYGSPKNVISGENTRDSVVAAIKTFRLNKEGKNILHVEPYKRKVFDNISNGRSLVVMGYSGSNDSNILHIIKILRNVQKIIWINHSESIQTGKEKIYEIYSPFIKPVDSYFSNIHSWN